MFSAGETSGDMHGANLARAVKKLAPDTQLFGFGGPQMEKAGVVGAAMGSKPREVLIQDEVSLDNLLSGLRKRH